MMEPISSVKIHALPGLTDGFICVYKKEWLDSFRKHLEKYVTKLENTMKVLMKQLLQPCPGNVEFNVNLGQNLKNTLRKSCRNFRCVTLEVFTEDTVNNKNGENYFGHLFQQLRSKGGSAFTAISDRLVLKSSSDLAFGKDSANMLKDKELKSKRQQINQIEADCSKA